ncbi:type II toxin-antitoxin system serine/threonine protein kinase toxin HipA [Desulfuromonas carbonis]|uniref:type II toxin-antitoxin system HipA family toxin n=1 Tax=Desulfuromonas sp. DDH964 TaxID=1823759 RepID=UPI00078BCD25|nr:type II toxin-antitoxin system HipA family toxin [Desulfuromonas sp. DDH964]AMV73086.1 Serine/threonine-protein kinase HipA [Desulfuromonas sp. DDH964]
MGRKRQRSELFVAMNGEDVGLLTRASTGKLEFRYDDGWLGSRSGRPLSLSMPLARQIYSGDVVENFFDNLLPDSLPIRNRIQKKFGARSNRGFDLLWHIGRDCIGAIQLSPEHPPVTIKSIESELLTDAEIAETLKSYRTKPLGMSAENEFRISMAGAQEKSAFLRREDGWHRPLGATPTSHIVKLPIGRIEHSDLDLSESLENEWLCHAIFKAYGVPIANAEIMTFESIKTLVVERFDRRWAKDRSWLIRLPQEDMCQALNVPPNLKYESDGGPGIEEIMALLLGSENSLEDRKLFMTQVFLFWVLGAIDGHAKNFSIFLLPTGAYRLTPAYDVISAYPILKSRKEISMAMAVSGNRRHYKWEGIFARHWFATAKRCNFPKDEMSEILGRVLGDVDKVIEKVAADLPVGFPDKVATAIFSGMRKARDRMI